MQNTQRLGRGLSWIVFSASLMASKAGAQNFAVGVAGSFVASGEAISSFNSFGRAGAHVFGEVVLDRSLVFQVRLSRFGLARVDSRPDARVDGASVAVAYRFQDEWFEGRIVGGLGGFRVVPRDSGPASETALGFQGGLSSGFALGRSWEARLEATALFLRTEPSRWAVLATGGLAYRF